MSVCHCAAGTPRRSRCHSHQIQQTEGRMASIDTGSGSSRRKAVDATLPLVPFIDLLLCCVMFLLVTAVWNELAVLSVTQQVPGGTADQAELEPLRLFLQLDAAG